VLLDLPFPKGITAHNEGHWSGKNKAIKNLRLIAKMITLDAMARGQEAVPGEHVINYLFFVDNNAWRDRANMVQMCKALIDGVVDAGAIDGDHWQVSWIGRVEVEIRRGNPGVRLEILSKIPD
jgi:hypothetical protein